MTVTWDEGNATHLFARAGFGATPQLIKSAVKKGMQKTVDGLFKIPKIKDELPKDTGSLEDLQGWWVDFMVKSKTPVVERLCLFWHNHFATGYSKVQNIDYMHRQNSIFRHLGMGKFRDLVTAVSKDPAMLIWLDNQTNVKGKQNQNFARELMELFTTGVLDKNGNANYTETDVNESAKAFTGWQVKDKQFFFNESKHDFGQKTFKGLTGALDGTDIINLLVVDQATARRIPQQLFSYFAYKIPLTDPILDELAAIYMANDTQILPVLKRIFTLDAFYSQEAKREGVKEPAVFLIAALKAMKSKLQLKIFNKDENKFQSNTGSLSDRLDRLGQALFDPPTVFGWKGGLQWVSAAGLLERAYAADWVSEARTPEHILQYKPEAVLGGPYKKLTAQDAAQEIFHSFGVHTPKTESVAAVANYLIANDNGTPGTLTWTPETIDKKVRGAIALVMSSVEYQRN